MAGKNNVEKKNRNQLRRQYVSQFYHKNRTAFLAASLACFVMVCINLAVSMLIKELLDAISGTPDALPLPTLAWLCLVILIAVFLAKGLEYLSKPRFMKKAMLQYRNYAFEKLTNKNIAAFREDSTAKYISAFSNDAASIETNYLEQQFNLMTNIVMFIGAFAIMLFYSPMLTVASVLFALLPIVASMFAGSRLKEAEQQVSDANAGFTAMIKEALSGFTVVKSFKAEEPVRALFEKSNLSAEDAKRHRRKISIVIGGAGSLAGIAAQFGVFLTGAYLALTTGKLSVGVVLAFVNLMNFVISPIAEVPGILAGRSAALALIDKLAFSLEENVRDEGETVPAQLKEKIEIADVSFGYESENPILRHLDVSFEAGKSYAVVGASGSGKSTLLNLLMAACDDYSGSISYDGKELRSINSESLYDMVSVIQQNVFVFNASIRDNITMFKEFAEAEVERAIRLSGLSELIARRGEDYLCGENGSGLSGGEKQRISIARSLLRKSPVLLVDEATAALDVQTAYQVSDAILGLKDLTRIVVTHSLEENLMRRYDGILALKSGRIAEADTFENLMEKRGYFYSLYTVAQA